MAEALKSPRARDRRINRDLGRPAHGARGWCDADGGDLRSHRDDPDGRVAAGSAVRSGTKSDASVDDRPVGTYQVEGVTYPLIPSTRCHTCRSPHRAEIETLVALGVGYSQVARTLPADAALSGRNIREHVIRNHLQVRDEVVRRLVEAAGGDRRAVLEIGIEQAVEELADAAMAVPELIDHLGRAAAHAQAGYRRHFALHGPDLLPTGLLLAAAEDWGVHAEQVLPVLAGHSPASRGDSEELQALRRVVALAGAPLHSIDDVARVAGQELQAFLAVQGWRMVTGYDLDARALIEVPELVVALAAGAADGSSAPDPTGALEAIRAAVPIEHHEELERLVEDARLTFGVRDDNGALTAAWPVGILRRAMLAAGRALEAEDRLAQVGHAVEVTVAELQGLLGGESEPSCEVVTARASDRAARSALVPPPTLGPAAELPLDALPRPMRTVARAQLILRDTFTAPLDARPALSGQGIGATSHRGRALVATDAADALARLEPGDVLIAYGTTPAYNLVLPLVGAVVVEEGGLLCHAAVIARELGLPALIGAAGAMEQIRDGALVEVDPAAGRVRVLHDQPARTA